MQAMTRSSRRQQVDDPLNCGVGAMIGGFEPAVRPMLRVWPVMEPAIGERPAQAPRDFPPRGTVYRYFCDWGIGGALESNP